MTDKTKQLFDAPWEVGVCEKGNPEFESLFVASKTGCLIARDMEEETANRLARLPELYDDLVEAAYEFCHNCISLTGDSEYVPDSDEFIEKGCPKKSENCFCRKWWDLLRNVRDGK